MSKTSTADVTSPAIEPTTKLPLLDPTAFEVFAKAAKQAVADGLARRALMDQTPPSRARH